MGRLYANENFPLPVVQELRRFGHDVLTIQETGKAGQSLTDEQILAFASAEGRAVLTLNRKHFVRLHASHVEHSGIVVCTFDPDFAGQGRRIYAALGAQSDVSARLIRVNRPGS